MIVILVKQADALTPSRLRHYLDNALDKLSTPRATISLSTLNSAMKFHDISNYYVYQEVTPNFSFIKRFWSSQMISGFSLIIYIFVRTSTIVKILGFLFVLKIFLMHTKTFSNFNTFKKKNLTPPPDFSHFHWEKVSTENVLDDFLKNK